LEDFEHYVVAAACVFLACKIDENELSIKECVRIFHYINPQFVKDTKEMILLEKRILEMEFTI